MAQIGRLTIALVLAWCIVTIAKVIYVADRSARTLFVSRALFDSSSERQEKR